MTLSHAGSTCTGLVPAGMPSSAASANLCLLPTREAVPVNERLAATIWACDRRPTVPVGFSYDDPSAASDGLTWCSGAWGVAESSRGVRPDRIRQPSWEARVNVLDHGALIGVVEDETGQCVVSRSVCWPHGSYPMVVLDHEVERLLAVRGNTSGAGVES